MKSREALEKFEDKFFENIEHIVSTKGRTVATAYFRSLRPMNKTDDASINRYETLLEKI